MRRKITKVLIEKEHYYYYQVKGTRWFNRAAIPFGRLNAGDMFNVYRKEYQIDDKGNITKWICDIKHGCIYDGYSIERSMEALDKELEEYYSSERYISNHGVMAPLTGNEPCV